MHFNLEEALISWRKSLYKQQGLEPGYIEELEGNLRDRIEDYLASGMSEADAFEKAVNKSIGNPENVADEFFIARTKWSKTPPWKKQFDILFLLPNLLKIAGRNIYRKLSYTLINLIGLIIGVITVSLVILFLNYELSFDNSYPRADQLYRVGQSYRSQGYSLISFDGFNDASSLDQLGQINGFTQITGIDNACQFTLIDRQSFVLIDDQQKTVDRILETNTPDSFFDMFGWTFITGSSASFSSSPYTAVLTESTADELFGPAWDKESVLDREIIVNDSSYAIAGVIHDIPANSHFDFQIAVNTPRINSWGARTYVEISSNTLPDDVFERIDNEAELINKRLASDELFNGFIFQSVSSIHLYSDLLYEMKPPGDVRYLYAFGLIAGIILLITLSNYTNLSIAINAGRNREIGMRKVMGARTRGVALQFLMETLIMTLLTIPIVLVLLEWLIPWFNSFMDINLENLYLSQISFFVLLCLTGIGIGLVAGIYPALYLSGRNIQDLFARKGLSGYPHKLSSRKLLITFQFMLLIGLVSTTYFINDQLSFAKSKDLGFRTSGILYVDIPSDKYKAFRNALLSSPDIRAVGSGSPLGVEPFNQLTYKLPGNATVYDDSYNLYMDYDAIVAYGLTTSLDGLLVSPSKAPDELFLINASAANKLAKASGSGPQDLIGTEIILEPEYEQEDGSFGIRKTISGIYEDIHLFSLREKIAPYFIEARKELGWTPTVVIHFDTDNISGALEDVNQAYDQINPDTPFAYEFQEDRLSRLYERENRIATLTVVLSSVAVLLAIVGLIALTAFLTTQKRKEMGIRKVLGASSFQIIAKFNGEYLIQVLIGLAIASPIAFMITQHWLSDFAYSVSVNPFVFVFTGIGTLFLVLLSVSAVAYKALQANPVDSLRDDQ